MGLSENEQKVLDELERQLNAGKPTPKPKTAPVTGKVKYGRLLVLGSVLFVVGLGLMVAAVSLQMVIIGVGAFLTMLFGLYLFSQNWTTKAFREIQGKPTPRANSKPEDGGFFQNRWDQRNRD